MKKIIITIILFLPVVLFAQNNQTKVTPIKRTQSTDTCENNTVVKFRCGNDKIQPSIFVCNNLVLDLKKDKFPNSKQLQIVTVVSQNDAVIITEKKENTRVMVMYTKDFITYN